MNKNFDYLGNTFQIQLLNQIVVDKDFSSSILDGEINKAAISVEQQNQLFWVLIAQHQQRMIQISHKLFFLIIQPQTIAKWQS